MAPDALFAELRPEWIAHQDDALIIIDKPAWVSTASSDGADDLLGRVKRHLALQRGTVADRVYVGAPEHLERDASGLVVLSLDKRANRSLAEQHEQHRVRRSFALVRVNDTSPVLMTDRAERLRAARTDAAKRGTPVIGDHANSGPAAHRAMCHVSSIALTHPLTGDALHLHAATPRTLTTLDAHEREVRTDPDYRRALLLAAAARRAYLWRADSQPRNNVLRWVNGAADGVAGLAIDVYDRWLVLHLFDERWFDQAQALSDELFAVSGCTGVYVKRHPPQKNELSVDAQRELASPMPSSGDAAPDPCMVWERGLPLFVRLGDGLRTGLFLDQRDNRARVRELADAKRVLNLFAYTCGFSVAALAGGASAVTSIDASSLVMSRVEPSLLQLNAQDRHRVIVGDCVTVLSELKARGEQFDMIVVDPPSYASTRAGRFRVRQDYAALVASAAAVASPAASLLCCTNHHGTTPRDLRGYVQQGLAAAGIKHAELRILPPGADYTPLAGLDAELKSVWAELGGRNRP